jgi:hypothetical protein
MFAAGFERIEDWQSCYFHPVHKTFLVIYVDDFKMSGPTEGLRKSWELIRARIKTDTPADISVSKYLGCEYKCFEIDGVRFLEYDMESSLLKCIEHYKNLAGEKGANLKKVNTPFIEEDVETAEEEERNQGKTCTERGAEYWEQWIARQVAKRTSNRLADTARIGGDNAVKGIDPDDVINNKGSATDTARVRGDESSDSEEEGQGELGEFASSVLMQVLYTARSCRYDLLRATGRLATMITRWTEECDKRLHRLMCYIHSSLDVKMVSHVGESFSLPMLPTPKGSECPPPSPQGTGQESSFPLSP